MNGFLALSLMLLITLVALGLCLIVLRRSKGGEDPEFDERQLQARGQAASLAAAVALLYYGALIVFLPEGLPHEAMKTLLFLGLYLDMLIAGTYTVLSDAYVGKSNTERGVGIGLLVVGILHLLTFGLNLQLYDGVIPLDGVGAGGFRSVIMGVGFGYLGILLLVKNRRNKREDDDG